MQRMTVGEPMQPSVDNSNSSAVLLCIDDNPDILECEKAFLETFGHRVFTATNGDEGLALASIHEIDVVVVDYLMPEMNGHEFAIQMRRNRQQVPFIMLSAAVDIPKQALNVVDAFIPKDYLSRRLVPEIARLHQ